MRMRRRGSRETLTSSAGPAHTRGKTVLTQRPIKDLAVAVVFLAAFVFWTMVVCCVDVEPIGPDGSKVGLATLNGAFHELTGVNWALYEMTDALSVVPVLVMVGFAVWGFCQMVVRRSFFGVDRDPLALGALYVALLAAYLLFEKCVVNYRPVLVEDVLEASYPSSTTLLVLGVMMPALMQVNRRVEHPCARRALVVAVTAFAVFMVLARLISGVHWLSDIVGGILLVVGLAAAYRFAAL